MNVICDACSTINLHNGDMLEQVLQLASSGFQFSVGAIVRNECGELGQHIDELSSCGKLVILHDDSFGADQFGRIFIEYGLGLGETECILHAEQRDLIVCSDDKAARRAARCYLGDGRVIGSLRLVRECVQEGKITSQQAYVGYKLMISRGAFLPDVPATYFDR